VRILLDTNILVSSVITTGSAKQFFTFCLLEHTICTSEFILGELSRILQLKFHVEESVLAATDYYFRSQMNIVIPTEFIKNIAPDPDDDNIISAAIAGNCNYIITGDKALLSVTEYAGIKIITMQEFRKIDFGK
jgi:putative PIN family toxin of toxin-antitoxin system